MAVVGVRWPSRSLDIHLLPDSSSGPLEIATDAQPDRYVPRATLGADVRVTFQPRFAGAPDRHGVIFDEATGEVRMRRASSALRNFLLDTTVTAITGAQVRALTVRVHLHPALDGSGIHVSPSQRTVRLGQRGVKFTVLAQFADTAYADVTAWPNLTWEKVSGAPGITIDARTGEIAVSGDVGQRARFRVTAEGIRDPDFEHQGEVDVIAAPPSSAPTTVEFVAGKGAAHWATAPNVLFLPDGFVSGEEEAFRQIVRRIVNRLGSSRIMRPIDLLKNDINYWCAFVASGQAGTSVFCELAQSDGRVAPAEVPRPVAPEATDTVWSVAHMIHEVGLPTNLDNFPSLENFPNLPPGGSMQLSGTGGYMETWSAVYGVRVPEERVRDSFSEWLALSSLTLAGERDTAFGLAYGGRPAVERSAVRREIGFNSRPTALADFEAFLSALSAPTVTGFRPAWSDGKDQGLVCLLVRSSLHGGTNHGRYGFILSLGSEGSIANDDALGNPPEPAPADLRHRSLNADITRVVAHELAHSLSANDEYGEWLTAPAALDLHTWGNVQPEHELLRASAVGLEGARIRWNWPRIAKAGVLQQPLQSVGPAGNYRAVLKPGHGAPFVRGDIVRLRRRPLVEHRAASGRLQVMDVAADELHLLSLVPGGIDIHAYPATSPDESVLFAAVLATAAIPRIGDDLPLVAPVIRDHITATGCPLDDTAPLIRPGDPQRRREVDDNAVQQPRNLPPGLRQRLRQPAEIVGVYEGGARYHCGVYHPSGACIMRDHSLLGRPPHRFYLPFCHVCRYLMVDRLDPSKHGEIDRDYGPKYPQP